MTVETKIRYVTKPGANLILGLGFSPIEAKRLQAASRKQINDRRGHEQRANSTGDGYGMENPS